MIKRDRSQSFWRVSHLSPGVNYFNVTFDRATPEGTLLSATTTVDLFPPNATRCPLSNLSFRKNSKTRRKSSSGGLRPRVVGAWMKLVGRLSRPSTSKEENEFVVSKGLNCDDFLKRGQEKTKVLKWETWRTVAEMISFILINGALFFAGRGGHGSWGIGTSGCAGNTLKLT